MNDSTENLISRGQKCLDFCEVQISELAVLPDIASKLVPALKQSIADALEADGRATQDDTGVTEEKSEASEALELSVFDVAAGIASYAESKDDDVLLQLVNKQISEVQGLRDNKLLQNADFLLKLLDDNPAIVPILISDHNTSADDIAELQANRIIMRRSLAIRRWPGLHALPGAKKGIVMWMK